MERANGLKTLTSKNVRSKRLPQNPSAAISRRAPSWTLAEAPAKASPLMVQVGRLNLDTMADLSEQMSSEVSDFIMADRGKSALGAGEGMVHAHRSS